MTGRRPPDQSVSPETGDFYFGTIEEYSCGNDRATSQAGAHLLFLPPNSPDVNLIELAFAKPQHLLHDAAERTAEATWRCIADLLDRFPPEECANHFRNSGHAFI